MRKLYSVDERPVRFEYLSSENLPVSLETSFCHDGYGVMFMIEGSGRCLVEGREYVLRTGSMMITKPLEYHVIKINADAGYKCYTVRFSDRDLSGEAAEVLKELLDREGEPRIFHFFDAVRDTAASLYERSKISKQLSKESSVPYTRTLIRELVFLLPLAKIERAVSYDGDISVRVIKYLSEHVNRHLSLDFLANRFGVSKYYLCRVFKNHNGISIHGYITQKRVIYAKTLIEAGETASSAACKVGFCDYSVFYRAFVKSVGLPPTNSSAYKET